MNWKEVIAWILCLKLMSFIFVFTMVVLTIIAVIGVYLLESRLGVSIPLGFGISVVLFVLIVSLAFTIFIAKTFGVWHFFKKAMLELLEGK